MRELPRTALAALVALIAARTGGALLLAQALADGIDAVAAGRPLPSGLFALGAAGLLAQAVAAW
ncbi:hypothetical protein, partial [Mesorhizobium japonicum]|uniref:hypothetical protein n=1 Tax=Mesorhizobium japonicum TaxID=2066070 RepID=UPI003B5B9807